MKFTVQKRDHADYLEYGRLGVFRARAGTPAYTRFDCA